MFEGCSSLEEIRFKPNTIKFMNYQIFNVSQVFSDDTLVSIANGLLKDSQNYPNIKFLSTPYARLSTLLGTVSDDFFTKDEENGDTTLMNFITQTKGWTVAL